MKLRNIIICTSCLVRFHDLWFAKDNRLLNPKSSYERILMAPTCRLIARSTIPCLSFLVFFILLVDELADGSIILSNSWSVPHSLAAVDIFGILVLVNRREECDRL